MAVSIKDIAREANVSYSLVSRALNDSPRVNAQTKARIQRLAAEMGYLPSAVARSLVTRRTNTLGIVVTTITDLFFAEVIHAIEETALNQGYNVILTNSGGQPERELAALRSLRERRVDGIILISGCSNETSCQDEGIGIPIVIINNVHREHIGYSVEVDNAAGSREAVVHLLHLGHRRIAHIAGPAREWDAVERLRGYEEALRAHGVAVEAELIVCGDNHPEAGIARMQQLLALPLRPTAVFCYNDATAIGAMRAARMAGLRVPEDLSVVGFDDIDLARHLEPPLTTVAQPKRQMGRTAVEMILQLLSETRQPDQAEEAGVKDCVLPSQLVVRESTAPLAGESTTGGHEDRLPGPMHGPR
jgi:DNA-binding LacI/PurR family transcriptional regulator